MLLASLRRHDECALLALDRDEVYVRVQLGHADGEAALAAADFEVQRIVVAEQRTPLSAQLLRLKYHDVRTGGKANVQIFLLAHSHA